MMIFQKILRRLAFCGPSAMNRSYLMLIVANLLLNACSHIGPGTVPRDRFDYNTAVADSWKEQTLLNIVKLRYADMPLFMEVASIVSGYSLESSVNLGGGLINGDVNTNSLSLGAAGKFTDRPTITYAPITGEHFNKNFMTPVPPHAVLFMLQAGWPADIVLPLTLDAINGLRSMKSAGASQREADAEYYRVIERFRQIQASGAMGMRVLAADGGDKTTLMMIRRKNVSADTMAAIADLEKLLGMRRGASEYSVAYGEVAQTDTELAMLTRSMLAMMVELASQISVPEQHIREGRTLASLINLNHTSASDSRRLLSVHHSEEKPTDAFISIRYKDFWYWIDDRDFKSKRMFAYMMILFSLTESGGKEGLPLVTIPAG